MPTINQTIKKVKGFARLVNGWHYGEGTPAVPEIIKLAENFLLKAEDWGLIEANAFPGIDGQIELTFYVKDKTFAFTFDLDNTFSITEETAGNIISDIYGQSYKVAEETLWQISLENQTISGSSTLDIGIQETKDLEPLPSSGHQQNKTPYEVYLLSRQNASQRASERFVNISRIFTARSPVNRPSFCR